MIQLKIKRPLATLLSQTRAGWAFRKGTNRIHYYVEDLSAKVHSLCSLLVSVNELYETPATSTRATESHEVCPDCQARCPVELRL